MSVVPEPSAAFDIERLLVAMRPRLHRYCAHGRLGHRRRGRAAGCADQGGKAQATAGDIGNPEGWLFRIAHNTALDFLRRRNRQEALRGLRRWI